MPPPKGATKLPPSLLGPARCIRVQLQVRRCVRGERRGLPILRRSTCARSPRFIGRTTRQRDRDESRGGLARGGAIRHLGGFLSHVGLGQ